MFTVLKGSIRKIAWLSEASRMNKKRKNIYLHLFLLISPPALERWAGQRAISLPERDGWGDERVEGGSRVRGVETTSQERDGWRAFGLKDGGGGGAHLHLSKCGDYVKTPSTCLKFHINSLTRSEKCASRHAHLSVAGCFQESVHSPFTAKTHLYFPPS